MVNLRPWTITTSDSSPNTCSYIIRSYLYVTRNWSPETRNLLHDVNILGTRLSQGMVLSSLWTLQFSFVVLRRYCFATIFWGSHWHTTFNLLIFLTTVPHVLHRFRLMSYLLVTIQIWKTISLTTDKNRCSPPGMGLHHICWPRADALLLGN